MKTIYVYLFKDIFTDEHIEKMKTLLSVFGISGETKVIEINERIDLNAFEYQLKATDIAVDFLEYMAECEMLHVTYGFYGR